MKYESVAAGKKRNMGVEIAKGEIIAFTDDDTILREDWLKNAVKHLEENSTHVGVGDQTLLLGKDYRLPRL